jgi:hypothetical protein
MAVQHDSGAAVYLCHLEISTKARKVIITLQNMCTSVLNYLVTFIASGVALSAVQKKETKLVWHITGLFH